MNKKTPSSDLLKRYLSADCTDAERKTVDAWYKTLQLDSDETFSENDQQILFSRIENQIAEEQPVLNKTKTPVINWWMYAGGIAAMLLLSLGLYHYRSLTDSQQQISVAESSVSITNTQKKTLRYELPDKSIIWLQPGAGLKYANTFDSDKEREINFSGEAFFDIARNPDRPFIIHSGPMKTVVLGTSFNIRANAKDITYQVSVVTGTVSVSKSDGTTDTGTLMLHPAQQATFSTATNHLTLHTIAPKKSDIEPWQPISLRFDDTSLSEIVSQLQKSFGVKIELANPKMNNCVLKVDFNQQNLPEILEMLNTLLGSNYEIEGKNIVITGDGCSD